MSRPIELVSGEAVTPFALSRRLADNYVWNTETEAFEVFDAGDLGDYKIPLVKVFDFYYRAAYPSAIPAGTKTVEIIYNEATGEVVDQSQAANNNPQFLLGPLAWAQSFVPTLKTFRKIKFFGYSTPEAALEIPVSLRLTLDGADLAIGTLSVAGGGGVADYDAFVTFPESVDVTPGTKYYIVIQAWANNAGFYSMALYAGDTVATPSQQVFSFDGSWTLFAANYSFKFQEVAELAQASTVRRAYRSQGYVATARGPIILKAYSDSHYPVSAAYAFSANPDGTVWNFEAGAFQAFDASAWEEFAIPLTLIAPGVFQADYPADIPADVFTIEVFFKRVGSDPAQGDPVMGYGNSQCVIVPGLPIVIGTFPSVLDLAVQPAGALPGVAAEDMAGGTENYALLFDYGVEIALTFTDADGVPIDISDSTEKKILLTTPDGLRSLELAALFVTDGTDGKIYITASKAEVVFAGNTVNGAKTVDEIAGTSALYAGMPVTGSGVPAGTVIESVDGADEITLSQAATATATATLTAENYTLSQAGRWSIQGSVKLTGIAQSSEVSFFEVRGNLGH